MKDHDGVCFLFLPLTHLYMKYIFAFTIGLLLFSCSGDKYEISLQPKETYTFYPGGKVKTIANFKTGKHPDQVSGFQVYEVFPPEENLHLILSLQARFGNRIHVVESNNVIFCEKEARNEIINWLNDQSDYSNRYFAWAYKPEQAEGADYYELYALRIPDSFSRVVCGEGITRVANGKSQNAITVNISFNAETANTFSDLTINNLNRRLALVVDGKVISAPNVISPITDGNVEISENYTLAEAVDIKQKLESYILNGEWHSYYENGKIKEIRNYKNGEQTGSWMKYDERGNLIGKRIVK